MRTPNKHRGEVGVTLNGVALVLRPEYEALAEIEQTLGEGLVPIAIRISGQRYGIVDLVVILGAGLKAAGNPVEPDDLARYILKEGLLSADLMQSVRDFLRNALGGGAEDDGDPGEGEDDADGETTPSPSAKRSVSPAAS